MKTFICLLLIISSFGYAQKLDSNDLNKLLRDAEADKQTEFLLSKKFMQVNKMNDKTLKFVYDKKISSIPEMYKEIIEINRDTVTYTLYNPKAYLKFKKTLEKVSRTEPTNNEDHSTTYHLMRSSIIFKENETNKSEKLVQREYVFKCFLIN